jgi:hypothetical protein
MGYSFYDLDGDRLSSGFCSGFFLDNKGDQNFSIQPEINFLWFSHEANLTVVRRYQFGTTNYNDKFSTFIMQLCLLPKFSLGKKSNVKIMAGPFLKFPLITTGDISSGGGFQVSAGSIACLRFDAQTNSGLIGFDIRAGIDQASAQSFKETSLTLGLSYVFGLK